MSRSVSDKWGSKARDVLAENPPMPRTDTPEPFIPGGSGPGADPEPVFALVILVVDDTPNPLIPGGDDPRAELGSTLVAFIVSAVVKTMIVESEYVALHRHTNILKSYRAIIFAAKYKTIVRLKIVKKNLLKKFF